MQIGFVGLGRMGGNMTRRLAAAGHTVVAWDRNADAVRTAASTGVSGASVSGVTGSGTTYTWFAQPPPLVFWVPLFLVTCLRSFRRRAASG